MSPAVIAIHAIGQAYALLAGIIAKSGVKQVDRLLSSNNFVVDPHTRTRLLRVDGPLAHLAQARIDAGPATG